MTEQGKNWDIPYAMNQGRHDQDNQGGVCFTFDCAYHPLAFQLAETYPKFKQLLCDIAIEGAGKWLSRQKETVSVDYKVMKRLRCKGTDPGSIVVSEKALNDPKSTPSFSSEPRIDMQTAGPKLFTEMLSQQAKDRKQANLSSISEEAEEEKPETTEEIEPTSVQIPKFKLVQSSEMDFGDFIDSKVVPKKRPKSLLVEISVPFLKKVAEAKIDISEQKLVFDVKNLYYLEVKLPFPVLSELGTAKFDLKRKALKVNLPVVQLEEKNPLESEKASDSNPGISESEEKIREKKRRKIQFNILKKEKKANLTQF